MSRLPERLIERFILNPLPLPVISWIDDRLHSGRPQYHCRSQWYCEYESYRTVQAELAATGRKLKGDA